MARTMGIYGVMIEDPGDLPGAVADALGHDGPTVLDVVTATQDCRCRP